MKTILAAILKGFELMGMGSVAAKPIDPQDDLCAKGKHVWGPDEDRCGHCEGRLWVRL